jgi:hypothetical protein
MSSDAAVQIAEASSRPNSRFAFLRRLPFLITMTVLTIVVAVPLGYRSSRLAGVPPIDEIVDRETEGRIDIDPDQNAFTFYNRAWQLIPPGLDSEPVEKAVELLDTGDWEDVSPEAKRALDECEDLLAEWKRGSDLDRGVRVQPADLYWPDQLDSTSAQLVSQLAVLRSAKAMHEGRSEDAWQWLRAVFRFSRHVGNPGIGYDRFLGISLHEMACRHIVRWAVHEDVTAEQLETVRLEVRDIYRLTVSKSESLKTSYLVTMSILSSGEWREYADHSAIAKGLPERLHDAYFFVIAEPELGRVLIRHGYANLLSQCDRPRWDRSVAGPRLELFQPDGTENPALMDPAELTDLLRRSPLATVLLPSASFCEFGDSEQARQAALELCLAAELFRRQHGRHPESLQALVPEFLKEIPRDVYGSSLADRMLMIYRETEKLHELSQETPSPAGLIIYSRGSDGNDDDGDIEGLIDVGLRIPFPAAGPATGKNDG